MTWQQKVLLVVLILVMQLWSGCGDKRADKERVRLELEEQARRETEAGNKAITDLNQRTFGKKPAAPTGREVKKTDGKIPVPQTQKP